MRPIIYLVCVSSILGSVQGGVRHDLIIPAPTQPRSARSILDLPIEKLDVAGLRMTEALRSIAEAIQRRSEGKLRFDYSIRYSRAIEYANRNIDVSEWKLRDPPVRLAMTNTTLRKVLQQLCRQTGWSYDASTPILLIDDASYFTPSTTKGQKNIR